MREDRCPATCHGSAERRAVLGFAGARARSRAACANTDEVRQHRGAAVAQERRDHAGERQHAQRAAGDQQDLQRRGRGQSRGQEELVIGAGAQRDAQRAVDQQA